MSLPSSAEPAPVTPQQAAWNLALLEAEVIAYDIAHGYRLINDERDAELRERMDAYRAKNPPADAA
jgi:hypothetical protein